MTVAGIGDRDGGCSLSHWYWSHSGYFKSGYWWRNTKRKCCRFSKYDAFSLSKFNLLVVFTYNLHFSNSVLLLFNHDIRFSTSTFVLLKSSAFVSFKYNVRYYLNARHSFYSSVTILSFVLKNEWCKMKNEWRTENKRHPCVKIHKSTSIHERRAWIKKCWT